MKDEKPTETPKPYELLGLMSRDVLHDINSVYKAGIVDDAVVEDHTTVCIQTMYYSALANLYMQSALPDEIKNLDGDMPPRLSLALDRSYIDYCSAAKWLSQNTESIEKSRSKNLYAEVLELDSALIINTEMFIAAKD